jgi:hypothetical protein
MNKRYLVLLFLIPLAIPISILLMRREKPCSSQVDIHIGSYHVVAGRRAGFDAGQRDALQRLSQEIKRCPNADTYVVRRTNDWGLGPFLLPARREDRIIYKRKENRLEEDSGDADIYEVWDRVTNHAINAVAGEAGTIKSLARYGSKAAKTQG